MENLSDKQTNWCVYMHENRVNGKKYIGITSRKPTNKWSNGHGYKRCPFFYAAIDKYGWDSFKHYILYTSLTFIEAEKLKHELIEKYMTENIQYGYNSVEDSHLDEFFSYKPTQTVEKTVESVDIKAVNKDV